MQGQKGARESARSGRFPKASSSASSGCVTRCDVATESHAKFGVSDLSKRAQAMHFAKNGQPGLQLDHEAGVNRMGQNQVNKLTNLEGVVCGARISQVRGCTCRRIHLACMEHMYDKEEDYNSWHSRQDMC